jgi:hypothetical protein
MHFQDENIFNILCRFFLLFAYYIYSHGRYNYQTGGGITITSLSLATFCQDLNFKFIIESSVTNVTCCLTIILFDWLIDWLLVSWRTVANSLCIFRKTPCSTISKKSLKIPKGQPEYVNRPKDNTMAKENR